MMVDLNLWRLTYGTTTLEFGTHESGYPFTRQVEIGAAGVDVADVNRPMGGGVLFGRDEARGRLLRFEGAHLAATTAKRPKARQWEQPLDLGRVMARAWAAAELRAVPGAVAMLEHVDRGVVVYGRPRNRSTDLAEVRHGWSTWGGEFATSDDMFYDATEQAVSAQVQPQPVAAFVFPLTFPITPTGGPVSSRAWVTSGGTSPTPATVEFHGPATNPTAELLAPDGAVLWRVSVDGSLAYDETFTVDTRPWVRNLSLNGAPAPGRVRGDTIDTLRVPPGVSELRFSASADPTGTATCAIRWRDAYDEL